MSGDRIADIVIAAIEGQLKKVPIAQPPFTSDEAIAQVPGEDPDMPGPFGGVPD